MSNKCQKCCCKKTECPDLPQPPPTCHSNIVSLDGMNCIHCYDEKRLCGPGTDLNANLTSFNFNEFHEFLNTPVNMPPINGDKARFTPNPKMEVPPCQKLDYPPEVPLHDQLPIVGKIILIVGGAKGLGKSLAEFLTSKGAYVIATSRHPDCYEGPFSYNLSKVPLDIRQDSSVECFFNKVIRPLGKLNAVIVVAGIHQASPITKTTPNDFSNMLQLKPIGYQRVLYASVPYLRMEPNSRFIANGGTDQYFLLPYAAVYSASNAFLDNWISTAMIEERLMYGTGQINNPISYSLLLPVVFATSLGEYEQWTSSKVPISDPPVKASVIFWNNTTLGMGIVNHASPHIYYTDAVFRILVAPQPGTQYAAYDPAFRLQIGDKEVTFPQSAILLNSATSTQIVQGTIERNINYYPEVEEWRIRLRDYFFGCKV